MSVRWVQFVELIRTREFYFGIAGHPVAASLAVDLPVTIGNKPNRIAASVLHGSIRHLLSRRLLSHHRCWDAF